MLNRWLIAVLVTLVLIAPVANAQTLRIAVASNFQHTLTQIVNGFTGQTGYEVKVSSASSGKLYAQIVQGAPFDLFLSADTLRPQRLEQLALIQEGSRYTYAFGKLAVYSTMLNGETSLAALLQSQPEAVIALANPKTAPYGHAAHRFLTHIGLWRQHKQVYGENVSQVLQFVASGNAHIGLISYAQVVALNDASRENFLLVDEHLYQPIEQQLVELTDKEVVKTFVDYLKSEHVRQLIITSGYGMAR